MKSFKEYFKEKRKEKIAKNNEEFLKEISYLKAVRLCYVSMGKYNEYGTDILKIGKTFGLSSPFMLPKGMSSEESCKVISFITEKIEAENNIEPCSESSVALTSRELEKYGFEKVESHAHGHFIVYQNITR